MSHTGLRTHGIEWQNKLLLSHLVPYTTVNRTCIHNASNLNFTEKSLNIHNRKTKFREFAARVRNGNL